VNTLGLDEWYEVYDGNNAKDTAVWNFKDNTFDWDFPVLKGRSVSTLFQDGKETQAGSANKVNVYKNNDFMTMDNFYDDPRYIFENTLCFTVNGGTRVSPFGVEGDKPYQRLDGTAAPNRSDGRIEGDFLEVYNETDAPSLYYVGLPKLHNFMRLKTVPGVMPGALGLWAD
jgi:hypothetical protein